MTAVWVGLATLCFYAFFYRFVVKRAGSLVRAVLAPLELETRHPAREVDSVGKLVAASVAQLLFAVTLMALLGISLDEVAGFNPDLLALGIVLGIGELALAGFLCAVAFKLVETASTRGSSEDWRGQLRSGWMRYFIATATVAPWWLAATTIALYVGVEELVFRGILISASSSHGAVVACAFSCILFAVAQVFGMPSLRAALVPLVGAAVIGPVHAVLFWQVRDVAPLVAAHLAYFSLALLVARSGRPAVAAAGIP